ncbi:MAG: hypothetical protein NC343_07950 [Muribaculum sp.]|nr:hypothetical protein [Muribaculaceae bacterium]MCM1081669.1 hypothetical protein [Muribaculum sp.]
MDNNQRSQLIARIRHLMQTSHLSQAAFSRRIGLDPSNISKYLTGRLPINDTLVNRIIVNMGISANWLKNGVGMPYEKRPSLHPMPVDDRQPDCGTIPLYDIDVAAGPTGRDRMFTKEHIIERISLPDFRANWVAVKAQGDSMQPVINNGAYICLLPDNEKENIVWGDIYVIVTENRRVVKYVRRNANPAMVTLKSANPDYDPIEVALDDIVALYPVKAIVNVNVCI